MLISQPLRNLPIKARSTTSVRATTKNSLMQLLKSSQEPLTNERSADRPSWLPVSLLTVARCRRSRLGLSWKLHLEFAADCGTDDEQLGSNANVPRSEEHTSELQSHSDLVCRLLLEKKKKKKKNNR